MPQVQAGQNLSTIAANAGLTPAQFAALNPQFAGTGNGYYQGLSNNVAVGANYILSNPNTPATPPAGGNTGTGTGGGTPPNTNTPVGEVFTPVDVGIENPDPFYNEYGSNLQNAANANIDENAIRSNVLSRFQDQINATNAIYDQELAKARKKGLQDIGSGTAILARRGLAGSARGMGIESNITENNLQIENSIAAQRAAALAAIMSQANTNATAELERQRAAKEKGATAYLDFLKTKEERINTAINGVAASLLKQGIKDIKEIDPLKLNEVLANLQKAYGSTNITPDKIRSAFLEAKTKKDKEDAAAQLEKDKLNPAFTLGKGQSRYVYDSKTGKYKLVGGGGSAGSGDGSGGGLGGGTYVPGKNTVVDSWVNQIQNGGKKITDIPASQAALRNQVIVGLNYNGVNGLGKPLITELGTAAKTTAQDLLNKFNAGSTGSVGKSALFNFATLPGTAKADFQNTFNSLKSQLALDGVKYLKGQGAVSDAERALLGQAVTKLNLNQSEEEFKKTLTDIIAKLTGDPDTGAPMPASNLSNDGTALENNGGGQPETITANGQTFYLQADGTYE